MSEKVLHPTGWRRRGLRTAAHRPPLLLPHVYSFRMRLIAYLLLVPLLTIACTEAPPPPTPHIVILVADDLGWADVGYHGSEIRTPTIDQLVEGGVELDRFYVLQVCSPTRGALLTGRFPMRYGLSSGVVRPWSDEGLDLDERILPQALKKTGYATHIVGKWHLGSLEAPQLPTERGFDHHYGQYLGMIDHFTRERDGGLDWHRDRRPVREPGYSTHLLRDEAVRIVEAHDPDTPLFLYVPFTAPHFPLQAPEEDVAAYADLEDPDRRVYAAMVTSLDQAIGSILEALERRGMRERSLVLFFSDNGALLSKGGSNEPLRGEKGGLHEGGIRVPAVASWPGILPAGSKVETPLHVADLYPTLLRLAGVPATTGGKPLDGLDVWPVLAEDAPLERELLLLNVEPHRGALLAGDLKLLADFNARTPAALADSRLAGLELYDLATDPGETTNLAGRQPERCLELLRVLERYRKELVPRPGDRSRRMPEDLEVPEVWGPDR